MGTLQMHVKDTRTLSMIYEKVWDYVVVEDPRLIAIKAEEVVERVHPYALSLDSIIHAASPQAEIILYRVPAFRDGMPSRCITDPVLCDFRGMQHRIAENYVQLFVLLDAPVAPAGLVWQQVLEADSTLNLWDVDRIHANFTGAYATACTICATILKKSPRGSMVPVQISDDTGRRIQNIAHEVVLNPDSDWNQGKI